MRAWIVEMTPGSEWPRVDEHPTGEDVYVLEGEMIEGDRRFPAGSWLHFLPGSSHRPRTEPGLRLLGFHPVEAADGCTARPGGVALRARHHPRLSPSRKQLRAGHQAFRSQAA